MVKKLFLTSICSMHCKYAIGKKPLQSPNGVFYITGNGEKRSFSLNN